MWSGRNAAIENCYISPAWPQSRRGRRVGGREGAASRRRRQGHVCIPLWFWLFVVVSPSYGLFFQEALEESEKMRCRSSVHFHCRQGHASGVAAWTEATAGRGCRCSCRRKAPSLGLTPEWRQLRDLRLRHPRAPHEPPTTRRLTPDVMLCLLREDMEKESFFFVCFFCVFFYFLFFIFYFLFFVFFFLFFVFCFVFCFLFFFGGEGGRKERQD